MICKHCGREIEDNSERCPYCKTPLIRIKVKRICAYCKTEIKKGDTVCPGCGKNVPEKVRELLEKDELNGSVQDDLEEKKHWKEKMDALSFAKNEEKDWDKYILDFRLLILSIMPPIIAIFFKVLVTKSSFLPWYFTVLLVYFVIAMIVSYFLDGEIHRLWSIDKNRKLGEAEHLAFYICPPYTLYFILKRRKEKNNPLLFFLAMHLVLFVTCFFI